jgi:hypothetical protein
MESAVNVGFLGSNTVWITFTTVRTSDLMVRVNVNVTYSSQYLYYKTVCNHIHVTHTSFICKIPSVYLTFAVKLL